MAIFITKGIPLGLSPLGSFGDGDLCTIYKLCQYIPTSIAKYQTALWVYAKHMDMHMGRQMDENHKNMFSALPQGNKSTLWVLSMQKKSRCGKSTVSNYGCIFIKYVIPT